MCCVGAGDGRWCQRWRSRSRRWQTRRLRRRALYLASTIRPSAVQIWACVVTRTSATACGISACHILTRLASTIRPSARQIWAYAVTRASVTAFMLPCGISAYHIFTRFLTRSHVAACAQNASNASTEIQRCPLPETSSWPPRMCTPFLPRP